jgi:hypothetical protein
MKYIACVYENPPLTQTERHDMTRDELDDKVRRQEIKGLPVHLEHGGDKTKAGHNLSMERREKDGNLHYWVNFELDDSEAGRQVQRLIDTGVTPGVSLAWGLHSRKLKEMSVVVEGYHPNTVVIGRADTIVNNSKEDEDIVRASATQVYSIDTRQEIHPASMSQEVVMTSGQTMTAPPPPQTSSSTQSPPQTLTTTPPPNQSVVQQPPTGQQLPATGQQPQTAQQQPGQQQQQQQQHQISQELFNRLPKWIQQLSNNPNITATEFNNAIDAFKAQEERDKLVAAKTREKEFSDIAVPLLESVLKNHSDLPEFQKKQAENIEAMKKKYVESNMTLGDQLVQCTAFTKNLNEERRSFEHLIAKAASDQIASSLSVKRSRFEQPQTVSHWTPSAIDRLLGTNPSSLPASSSSSSSSSPPPQPPQPPSSQQQQPPSQPQQQQQLIQWPDDVVACSQQQIPITDPKQHPAIIKAKLHIAKERVDKLLEPILDVTVQCSRDGSYEDRQLRANLHQARQQMDAVMSAGAHYQALLLMEKHNLNADKTHIPYHYNPFLYLPENGTTDLSKLNSIA